MALFSSLIRLNSSEKEDFHTEIVGALFRHHPQILAAWFRKTGVTKLASPAVEVRTQEELAPLENHNGIRSRPDLVIRLHGENRTELIYLESKLGSEEGDGQLARYADHLAVRRASHDQCTLIYITRDYDPKKVDRERVIFCQLRWSDLFSYLRLLPSKDALIKELLIFMEEMNMSHSNQFSALDVLALTNFSKARKVMDESMGDAVYARFREICGPNCSVLSDAMGELRRAGRYTLYSNRRENNIQLLLGYWLHDESITDTPTLGLSIEINPTAPDRHAIIKAIREFVESKKPQWQAWDLENSQTWSGVSRERYLATFMSDPDENHVKVIQLFFEECLAEANEFIESNPHLPWGEEIKKAHNP